MNTPQVHRNFTGIWIPREIYLDTQLSWTKKILLVEIHSLDAEDTGCIASTQYLGDFLGITERSVSSMISELIRNAINTITIAPLFSCFISFVPLTPISSSQ